MVEKVAAAHELPKTVVSGVIDTLFDAIVQAVKKGDGFTLQGFGSFKSATRAARAGRNPFTGEAVKIPAKKVPKFVAGSAFKAALDPKGAAKKASARAEKAAAPVKKAAARKSK